MRIAALASGSGTILEALIRADLSLSLVLVDRPCRAEEVARTAGIPVISQYRMEFGPDFDRDSYSRVVVGALLAHEIDLVVMAGFGTVLGEPVIEAFSDRVLNTHPALLPSFKGWHAVADALAAGVKVTGCTVHLATVAVDEGRILAQEAVVIAPDDTEASLHDKIKSVERRIYPEAIRAYAAELEAERENPGVASSGAPEIAH